MVGGVWDRGVRGGTAAAGGVGGEFWAYQDQGGFLDFYFFYFLLFPLGAGSGVRGGALLEKRNVEAL